MVRWCSLRVCLSGFLILLLLSGCDWRPAERLDEASAVTLHLHLPPREKQLSFSVDAGQLDELPDDAFGRQWRVKGPASELVIQRAGLEVERLRIPKASPAVWFFAGSREAWTSPPPVLPQNEQDLVIYFVPDAASSQRSWGLHVWDAVRQINWTPWEAPLPMGPLDPVYGFPLRLDAGAAAQQPAEKLGLIVHDGDEKATSHDIVYEPARSGPIVFLNRDSQRVACSPDGQPCGWEVSIEGASAHWVNRHEILWQAQPRAARYVLLSSADARLNSESLMKLGQDASVHEIPVKPRAAISARAAARFPHLSDFVSFAIDADASLPTLLQSQLLLAALDANSRVIAATRVQLGGVLDDAFAYQGSLGLVQGQNGTRLKLWAPTAQKVALALYGPDKRRLESLPMQQKDGVWSIPVPQAWLAERLYYRYDIQIFHPSSERIERYEVSDPYALSGSMNGAFSQLLDIEASDLKPAGWDASGLPAIKNPTDMVLYELHIRDFSARDFSVPEALRGTYLALTQDGKEGRPLSQGMRHLQRLQAAGLTHVQLLPAFDFGSVDEDASQRLDIDQPFARLCAVLPSDEALCQQPSDRSIFDVYSRLPKDTDSIARLNRALIDRDSFNWGYDPVHYGMPEGSYTSGQGADGAARVKEFRSMVKALADNGLHVAMDVVYNHSYASGLAPFSVLDRVVPGYYHRLNPLSGTVERSSCCENTASERVMMEKLMVDTLLRWHQQYKVDAFRFDLMGLHYKENMLRIQKALGPDVFLYGEGWSMGEVNSDARRSLTATQANLAGTGIGTFNDRFRDAVRGGGPMDCGRRLSEQSPVNGLYFDDNGRGGLLLQTLPQAACTDAKAFVDASMPAKKKRLLELQDRLRLGLAGSLRDYTLRSSSGELVTGSAIDYSGQKAGYVMQPRETINYIENHDNQTLWDNNQLKLPYALSMEERVRVQSLGHALNMLAMGVPYFTMGSEFLRSKSLVRDSYNAGDWFNQVDFSLQRSQWNQGLPDAAKDGDNLGIIKDVITHVPDGPDARLQQQAFGVFLDFLAIRRDSPLWRLASAAEIQERVDFLAGSEQQEGLIALRIHDEDCGARDLDARYSQLVVLFNFRPETIRFPYAQAMELHPLQRQGADARVKEQARSDGQGLIVPARTAAVFVARPGSARCRPEAL